MVRVTSKTVRVTGMPLDTDLSQFVSLATRLSQQATSRTFWASRQISAQFGATLATQNETQTGIITFSSKSCKKRALKSHNTTWRFDDEFDGATVLWSPLEPDLDICAIHGLNGNAFQSWASKVNDVMWLRDLLPSTKPFDNARIMTFGYSSQLINRANGSGMTEWVDGLLTTVSSLRSSEKERQRPIIFVCHSMGGIVARQAMVRLNQYDHKQEYQGIKLSSCGLLFLSTPHSGSTQADWNDFLQATARLCGVRSELVDSLKSFNPQSTEGQEDFANLKIQLPFDAFYETNKTLVGTRHLEIVSRQSTSLNGKFASPLQGTDHSTICKYEDKFGAFTRVAEKLRELKRLLSHLEQTAARDVDKAWYPPPNAFNIYQPRDKKFFLGQGINRRSNLIGRETELGSLNEVTNSNQNENQTSVAISGIGGIGKTVTLLELAHRQKDQRDIFFVHPKAGDAASLNNAYYHIARHVGPEYLLKSPPGRDLQGIWSNESKEDKIERLKEWLGEPENDRALLLLDDLDNIRDLDLRATALPSEAKNILVTTRNPVFHDADDCIRHQVRIAPMPLEDIIMIMEDVRDKERKDFEEEADLHSEDTLLAIARAVHGHPLASANAIKYIIHILSLAEEKSALSAGQDFVTMFEGPDFIARRHFLDFKLDAPSIMDTFLVSQNRLANPKGLAWALMKYLSMLETSDESVDYRNFFFTNTFEMDPNIYPDHALLSASKHDLSQLLLEIQSVSFGERLHPSKPFQFHPLWLECTRHAMHSAGRVQIISQVLNRSLRVLKESVARDEEAVFAQETFPMFYPHIAHCMKMCKLFQIKLKDLKIPVATLDYTIQSMNYIITAFKASQQHVELDVLQN